MTSTSTTAFEYKVEEKGNNFEISLLKNKYTKNPELSSGEKFMISLLLLQFDFDRRAARNIILLDEPDRYLDQKLIETLFKIVYEEFCQKHDIQIIMTTHRSDTISFSISQSSVVR